MVAQLEKAQKICHPGKNSDEPTAYFATGRWQGERLLGDADRSGVIKGAEGKDHYALGREEMALARRVKEGPISAGPADHIGLEAIETSDNVCADGRKRGALSRGKRGKE